MLLNRMFFEDTVTTFPPIGELPPAILPKAPSIFSLPAAGLAQNQFLSHRSVLFLLVQLTTMALPLTFQVPHFCGSRCFDIATSNSYGLTTGLLYKLPSFNKR